MPTAKANGIAIAYESLGAAAAEPVLLIAGLGVQMIRWTLPFCEILAAQGFRVIRLDNRDVGLSTHLDGAPIPDIARVAEAVMRGERPDVPYTLQDMADDAVGLLDALAIERAHVVGRSMGGMIAMLAASRHPSRVLSLTAIMSTTGNRALPPATPEALAALMQRPPSPDADRAGFLDHAVGVAKALAGKGYPLDEAGARERALAELERAYDPAGFARQLAAVVAGGDLRPRLATIEAPTLVVHGSDDPLIPLAAGRDIVATIPGAELLVLDGMGHDFPAALHKTVADAIARNARRATRPG